MHILSALLCHGVYSFKIDSIREAVPRVYLHMRLGDQPPPQKNKKIIIIVILYCSFSRQFSNLLLITLLPVRVRVFGLSSAQFSSVQGTSYLSSVQFDVIFFVSHQLRSVQSLRVILSQFNSIQFSSYLFWSQLSLAQFDSRNDLFHFS